ncbi:YtxH-like protein [Streptococcus constellatus]|uniref:YtxH-like protein n=1 Tax=Streptococcus constellatus TaxID=76860 RepID=A0A564SAA0_STRCV|nr:YtxH domain-containing protein [Streptococcus constellatus]VUW92054.1 YtxH-like protein [Streptococcus constellatus]VUX12489.1 YtxH-like protein [Streptococcus gordonii]
MGKFSSILLGTISGAAAAVFLTSKKGKEVTAKVSDFMNEVKENPDDFKDQVVQKANHFSNQAAEAVNQAKEKVESGEITGETILDSVKEATKQVVDFSQEKFQEWKEKMEPEGISPEEFKKSAPESAENEPTSEDIVIDLTEENQESENEDKKIED